MSTPAVVEAPICATPRALAPAFARHETFHPRYGWLRKGFEAVSRQSDIFSLDDAHVRLGVGKNMAKAIRYWLHAFKLIDEISIPKQRATKVVPSEWGKWLMGDLQTDPYLEQTASLWLLHWKLLQSPCYATAWHFGFNLFSRAEFTIAELEMALGTFVAREHPDARVAPSSIEKDVHCLVRMYCPEILKTNDYAEETLQCPFVDLGLIRQGSSPKHCLFNRGHKHNLPPSVVTYACLEYVAGQSVTNRTISLSRLLYEPGSPGMVFKIGETAICEALQEISKSNRDVGVSEAAGILQMYFPERATELSQQVMRSYYGK